METAILAQQLPIFDLTALLDNDSNDVRTPGSGRPRGAANQAQQQAQRNVIRVGVEQEASCEARLVDHHGVEPSAH